MKKNNPASVLNIVEDVNRRRPPGRQLYPSVGTSVGEDKVQV